MNLMENLSQLEIYLIGQRKASVVRTFVGSLFLAREGRIDIIQKELDSHNIYVKNLENAG